MARNIMHVVYIFLLRYIYFTNLMYMCILLNVVCRIWTNVTIFSSYRNFIFSFCVLNKNNTMQCYNTTQHNTTHIARVLPSCINVAIDLPFFSCFMYMYYFLFRLKHALHPPTCSYLSSNCILSKLTDIN